MYTIQKELNFSLTKKRLIMSTKKDSLAKSVAQRIVIIHLVFILTVTMAYCQETISSESLSSFDNEWWYPIIDKHKIEVSTFNNFQDVFETGTSNSIENRIVTLTDANIILKQDDGYMILKSPLAYHDLNKNTISGDEGNLEIFKYDSEDISPTEKRSFKEFIFELHQDKRIRFTLEKVEGQVNTKK